MSDKKWSTADKDTQLIFEGWNNFLNEEEEENLDEGLFDRLKAAGKAFMSSGDEETSDVKDKTAEPEKAGPTDEEVNRLIKQVTAKAMADQRYAAKYMEALLWKGTPGGIDSTRVVQGLIMRAAIIMMAFPKEMNKSIFKIIDGSMKHMRALNKGAKWIAVVAKGKNGNAIAAAAFKDFLEDRHNYILEYSELKKKNAEIAKAKKAKWDAVQYDRSKHVGDRDVRWREKEKLRAQGKYE